MDTTTDIQTTIDRYLDSFNELDEDARTGLARDVWATDGHLVDPLVDATGPDAISTAIGQLQAKMPDHSMSRTTAVDSHHDQARFGWAVSGPDGSVAVAGIDVVTFAKDGRLQRVVGFFGDLAGA